MKNVHICKPDNSGFPFSLFSSVFGILGALLVTLGAFFVGYVGRQNFEQGTFAWNKRDGNWKSGIKAFDSAKLYNQDRLPRVIKEDKSSNSYYFIPLILGLCGVFFQRVVKRKL